MVFALEATLGRTHGSISEDLRARHPRAPLGIEIVFKEHPVFSLMFDDKWISPEVVLRRLDPAKS